MQTPGIATRAPRTIGVLSITFAAIVLFFSLFGMLSFLVPTMVRSAPATRPEDAAALAAMSGTYTAAGLMSAMLAVMSALLLALGIGQLRYRKWAAVWSVRWAVVALGCVALMAIWMVRMPGQMMHAIAANAPSGPPPEAAGAVGTIMGVVYAAMMVFFYAPYPIVLLVMFTRPRLRAAMTA